MCPSGKLDVRFDVADETGGFRCPSTGRSKLGARRRDQVWSRHTADERELMSRSSTAAGCTVGPIDECVHRQGGHVVQDCLGVLSTSLSAGE